MALRFEVKHRSAAPVLMEAVIQNERRNPNRRETEPLKLSRQQLDVLQSLQSRETENYPISQWYLGALYALRDIHNPDRISQAAQSLRELLEKLPRVVLESDLQVASYNATENRRAISARIAKDRERYPEGWAGKLIDPILGETLEKALLYFETSQQPSRREQVQMAVVGIDPLASQFDTRIRDAKRDHIYKLWQQFERFAHHGGTPDAKDFEDCLGILERVILDLLAPITAQDQQEIRSILNRADRSGADVDRVFALMERRGANYAFFFDHATDPGWIPILREKGYFSDPSNMEPVGDGQVSAPYWWPIHYLSRIVHDAPDEVVEIVLQLPKVDNPKVKLRILDIARQLPGIQSVKLKPKVLDFGTVEHSSLGHWYSGLLAHWVAENETHAALELAEMLVQFEPDPQLEYERTWYLENQPDWNPPIPPTPRLREWEYKEMIEKGVHPLAEKEPHATVRILVNATEEMIRLQTQEESQHDGSDEDSSEVWCRRLGRVDEGDEQSINVLVEVLTFACEQVFGKDPGSLSDLDELLRSKQWTISSVSGNTSMHCILQNKRSSGSGNSYLRERTTLFGRIITSSNRWCGAPVITSARSCSPKKNGRQSSMPF